MRVRTLHRWNLAPRAAIALQKRLRASLVLSGGPRRPRWIAAADSAFREGKVFGAVVLWDAAERKVAEEIVAAKPLRFPYVPGLLSFREAPALLAAFRKLRAKPDLVLVDGQGLAHPRRFGIASHLGLLLDLPTIGVGKSRLVGEHEPLPWSKGSVRPLFDRGERIGLVYRSRDGGNPLFLSPGHRIGFARLVPLLDPLFLGHRLPEPLWLADRSSKTLAAAAGRG